MANNFDSNITRKLMRSFLNAFESERVLSKNVNTQLFQGAFNPPNPKPQTPNPKSQTSKIPHLNF